jgi:hypothetical protein
MSAAGRQRVLECWTWEQAAQQLEKNMQKTIEKYAERDLQK